MTFMAWFVLGVTVLVSAGLLYTYVLIIPQLKHRRILEALRVFGTVIELRFPYQKGLTERVEALASALAEKLDFSDLEKDRLVYACRLRDIGLCAVPWVLFNERQPNSWSESERATFEKHPEIGGSMLELIPSLKTLAPIVRSQLVAFDGSSGPNFPQGIDLPRESRLINLVVSFLCAERECGIEVAIALVSENVGSRFDPAMVEALLELLPSSEREVVNA